MSAPQQKKIVVAELMETDVRGILIGERVNTWIFNLQLFSLLMLYVSFYLSHHLFSCFSFSSLVALWACTQFATMLMFLGAMVKRWLFEYKLMRWLFCVYF